MPESSYFRKSNIPDPAAKVMVEIYFLEIGTCLYDGHSRTYWSEVLYKLADYKVSRQTLSKYYFRFSERLAADLLGFKYSEYQIKQALNEIYDDIMQDEDRNRLHYVDQLKHGEIIKSLFVYDNVFTVADPIERSFVYCLLKSRAKIARSKMREILYEEYVRAAFFAEFAHEMRLAKTSTLENPGEISIIVRLATDALLANLKVNRM